MVEFFILFIGFVIGGTAVQSNLKEPEVRTEIKYVDIQTYKTWGTTKLVPIGVRPLPSETELQIQEKRENRWQ